MAKSVIDRKKEPGIAPLRYDRARQARGERIAVIDPGCFGRRTGLTGKSRAPDRAGNGYPVVLRRELLDRKGDGRIVEADRHVHLLGVEPLAGNRGADVGLVLVVGEHDLDWLAQHRAPGILDRHARSDDRAWAAQVSVEAGLIIEDANSDDTVGDLRACSRSEDAGGCKGCNKRE